MSDMTHSPFASSATIAAAGASRHPLAFCPHHSGEKSPLPAASARARSGAIADTASGNAGAGPIGPISRMMRLTIPRAGRPVKRLVSAVRAAASLASAARWTARRRGLGAQQERGARPARRRRPTRVRRQRPAASAMPPAAMTGTFTAFTICGTSANVESCVDRSSVRKMPRWPPASTPLRDDASTPCDSRNRASSTVVAETEDLGAGALHARQRARRREARSGSSPPPAGTPRGRRTPRC